MRFVLGALTGVVVTAAVFVFRTFLLSSLLEVAFGQGQPAQYRPHLRWRRKTW